MGSHRTKCEGNRNRFATRAAPPRRIAVEKTVIAATGTVTVQSLRYSSVQLEASPMSTVPLAQIPAPHDTATLTLVD
ncbi:hypothetical protein, partial [Burkholderia pseudomallei]|uniref:hypothetical protein n=1 Tax=Burkholderia pseudomallei TaxID=28450 RepID=UPI001F1D86C8